MELAIVHSRACTGITSPPVTVEVHVARGLPKLNIVGLAETAVKESQDRVRSAIVNNNFEFPRGRITVNLAPADLPKEGGRFDLAIAVGVLAASGQVNGSALEGLEFLGELALTGELRPVRGVLPAASAARADRRALVLPTDNAAEAGLVRGIDILPAAHLTDVCEHLNGVDALQPAPPTERRLPVFDGPDLAEVRSQHRARRALEVAAAGGHNLLMTGPPGTGKTMLAERLPGILPPMTEPEALESAAVASISERGFDVNQWFVRPLRAPHHTASAVALVGGGGHPRPGEISLAHNGVLFLDELPEFDRRVLEALREPLESGRIVVSRAARRAEFPADFQFIAAMNPCPCGYLGDPGGRCRCPESRVQRYRQRVSGPLLDRIDIHVEVPRITHDVLKESDRPAAENSACVRERVSAARSRQLERAGVLNSRLKHRDLTRHCRLSTEQRLLLLKAVDRLGLSARAMHRVIKLARTIADLAGETGIADEHLAEAVSYRRSHRFGENG